MIEIIMAQTLHLMNDNPQEEYLKLIDNGFELKQIENFQYLRKINAK